MGAHTTSDDPTRYRTSAELDAWRLKDPIERVRAYLSKSELAGDEFFEDVDAEAERLGRQVRDDCRALPDPEPQAMFENVYAGHHAQLAEECAAFTAYLGTFADQ
jgi:pyruvate dehydrogenase E1 component alpha subunit